LLIIVIIYFILPNLKNENDLEKNELNINENSFTLQLKNYFNVLTIRNIRIILLILSFASFGITIFQSMFSLAAKNVFNMESDDLGVYISYVAFIGLFSNVFVVGWMVKFLNEFYTILISLIMLSLSYFIFSYIDSYNLLLLISIPATIASTILYTLSSSMLSLAADKNNQGTAISLSHSFRSLIGKIIFKKI
jgi:Na+/melibiose symporter-like transporter